jgi:1-acyl-sn-glycerol-3-phosphate acyltransferase
LLGHPRHHTENNYKAIYQIDKLFLHFLCPKQEKAEAQLTNGVSVVIFPEGTRTYDGKMIAFKRGAFRIATDLCLPIVPVTLRGCFERLPPVFDTGTPKCQLIFNFNTNRINQPNIFDHYS